MKYNYRTLSVGRQLDSKHIYIGYAGSYPVVTLCNNCVTCDYPMSSLVADVLTCVYVHGHALSYLVA